MICKAGAYVNRGKCMYAWKANLFVYQGTFFPDWKIFDVCINLYKSIHLNRMDFHIYCVSMYAKIPPMLHYSTAFVYFFLHSAHHINLDFFF